MIRRLANRARIWTELPGVGYTLLAVSVVVALTQVFYVYYNIGDEGDNLATGWLVANGWSLYKEIFSHHFPFPYLWIAVIVKIFGTSFFAMRLSLILLRTFVLAVAMKISRYHLAIGLTSLAWSFVGHLYLGNGVIYQSFSGIFAVGGFAIGLALVSRRDPERAPNLFIASLFLGLAIMSDPIMIFPTIIYAVTITISSISYSKSVQGLQVGGYRFVTVIAGLSSSILPILVYLLISEGLQDFYQNGILFNSQVYSNYAPPINFNEIIKPARGLLGIFDERWRFYLSPFFEWASFEFLDNWVFTGFFFRLSIILGSVTLFVERKFLGAIFIYLFGAMVLIRSEAFFHASPFVFVTLFCVSWLISRGFRFLDNSAGVSRQFVSGAPFQAGINIFATFAWIILIFAFAWLNIRGGKFLIDHASELSYSQNFAAAQGNADFLNKATCGLDDAQVLIYPLDPIQYFLAEIPPASKYHFMTPWVADVGQRQVIQDLESGSKLVYVNRGTNIWGFQVEEYLAELLAFLDERYVQIEPNYYASSTLLLKCPYDRE